MEKPILKVGEEYLFMDLPNGSIVKPEKGKNEAGYIKIASFYALPLVKNPNEKAPNAQFHARCFVTFIGEKIPVGFYKPEDNQMTRNFFQSKDKK